MAQRISFFNHLIIYECPVLSQSVLKEMTLWFQSLYGGFLEMGVPPVIIHFNRLFPKINHLFGILHPHLWKPPYVESPFRFDDSILDPFVISLENPPANRPMIFSSLRPFKASNYRGFSLLKPPWRISQPFSKPFPSVIFQPATNSAQSRSHQVNGRTCWMKRTFL